MKMEERDRQIREDGKKEGIKEGIEAGREEGREEGEKHKVLSLIQKKLDKGQTIEEIADALEEDPAVIKELMKELEERFL